jgi:hypothetical protein
MTIRGFGNLLPIHFSILGLIGWRLTRAGGEIARDESERLELMREGHAGLVQDTGQDFGYDLRRWREFLLAADGDEFGYRHPYGFGTADRAVRAAIDDPDFARLAVLAAAGDAAYAARLARKLQARRDAIAAKDAAITDNRCPACGQPCPTYRRTCKHCRRAVRGTSG